MSGISLPSTRECQILDHIFDPTRCGSYFPILRSRRVTKLFFVRISLNAPVPSRMIEGRRHSDSLLAKCKLAVSISPVSHISAALTVEIARGTATYSCPPRRGRAPWPWASLPPAERRGSMTRAGPRGGRRVAGGPTALSGRGVVGQLLPRPAAAAGDHSPREPGSLPPGSAPRGPLSARGRLFYLSEKGIWRSKK